MSRQHLPYCACPLCKPDEGKPDEDEPRWVPWVMVLLAVASTMLATGMGLWVYTAIAHAVRQV